MERCACKKSLIAKCIDIWQKGRVIMHRDNWHVRRELLIRAVWLTIIYGAAQLAGCRQWTLALLQGASAGSLERIGCMTYLFLYGCFVFLVPILVISTLLLTIWEALGSKIRMRRS